MTNGELKQFKDYISKTFGELKKSVKHELDEMWDKLGLLEAVEIEHKLRGDILGDDMREIKNDVKVIRSLVNPKIERHAAEIDNLKKCLDKLETNTREDTKEAKGTLLKTLNTIFFIVVITLNVVLIAKQFVK